MIYLTSAALLLGFLAGLLLFKVKSRWCPRCGSTTKRFRPSETAVTL
jgi:hypothetical protein